MYKSEQEIPETSAMIFTLGELWRPQAPLAALASLGIFLEKQDPRS
jgi:hypothetical protein